MKKQTYFILLLSLLSTSLWAQPTADFTVDITEGCSPLTVNFTNNSTGSGLTYVWDFYDGNTSEVLNPAHTYLNGFSYSVSLTVTDDMGLKDTLLQPGLITVYEQTAYPVIEESYCENEACFFYSGDGQCYVEGNYAVTLVGSSYQGCDSTVNLIVTALPEITVDVEATICDGDFYQLGTTQYTDPGFYTETFVSVGGCDSIVNLDLIVLYPMSIIDPPTEMCGSGSIYLDGFGSVGDEYFWSTTDGDICDDPTNLFLEICLPGTYCLLVTSLQTYPNGDQYACTDESCVTVESSPTMIIDATISDADCTNALSGAIDITVTGGSLPLAFEWSTAEITEDIDNLTAGSYTVTVTDISNCVTVANFEVVDANSNPMLLSSVEVPATCGNADGSIDLTITGGVLPYEYNWNDGLYFVQDPTGLVPFLYNVVVTDAVGCTAEYEVLLTQTGGPTVTFDATPSFCFDENTGSIDLTVTGGVPNYSFLWSNGESVEDINDLDVGTYSVTVTDAANCSIVVNPISITSPDPITITANVTNSSCAGSDGSIDISVLGGTGPYIFLWSNNEITEDISNLDAGTYAVTVNDINGCQGEEIITVFSDGLSVSAAVQDISCAGGNDGAIDITVNNGTAPFEFLWSIGAITEDISGLSAGLYMVTITDANFCIQEEVYTIAEPALITFTPIVNQPLCNGDFGCIEINPVGGTAPYTFEWSDGNTGNTYCTLDGTFSVTVTDDNNCAFTAGPITITQPTPLEISSSTTCATPGQNDGIIVVNVSGGTAPYLYEWSNGFIGASINNLSNDTYTVTVTDANGCTVTYDVLLGVIEAMSNDTIGCAGAAFIYVIAPTAISYSWEPAAFLDNATIADPTASVTDSTLFTVTVIDANGCEDTGEVWVNIPDGPGFVLNGTNPTCNGADGIIELDLICSTTAPYTYDWSDLAGTNDPEDRTGLTAGIYTVTVVDDNGVTTVESIELIDSGLLNIVITGATSICEGEELVLCAPSSVGATFQWTGPAGFVATTECMSIPNADIGQVGCYTLLITDAAGCAAEETVCIEVLLQSDIITDIIPDQLICSGESTTLEVTINGSLAGATVSWSPDNTLDNAVITNPVASPLVTTIYTVVVVDGSTGCAASETVTVNVIPDCVWPGDTDTNKVVNNFDLLNIGLAYDSIGPVRPGASMLWSGQDAPAWTQSVAAGTNYKHIDCDGDGVISSNDTLAITGNWGETHNLTGEPISQFSHDDYPVADGAILTTPFYVQPDTLIEGAAMSLPIILGEEANAAEDIYGIAFSLVYDTAYIVDGSVAIGFDASWLGETNNNMITIQRNFPSAGRVDIAMTRIDGTNITDYGQLAQLFITVEDDILFAPGGDSGIESMVDEAVFNITNVLVLNKDGEEIPVIPTETTAPVETATSNDNIVLAEAIQVYPNPAKDRIWITTKNIAIENVGLYDLNGQLLQFSEKNTLNVEHVTTGLYLIKIQTAAGVHVEKVMVE